MGTPGPAPEVTLSATLETFRGPDRRGTPRTAREVSDELGCSRRTAHRKLERLSERGDLETKKVGARSRVWWRPVEGGGNAGEETTEHAQFGAFVQAVRDYAIFMLDRDGHVDSWNEGARRIKGYEEDEILGEHVSTFYTDDDRQRGVPSRNLREAADAGRTEDEGWRVRRDGTEFWADVGVTAVRDDDGSLQGYIKVTRDLTGRKRAEDERALQHSVSSSIATAASLDEGLESVLASVCDVTAWEYGEAWVAGDGRLDRLSAAYAATDAGEPFAGASTAPGLEPGEGLVGRVLQSGSSEWVTDVPSADGESIHRAELANGGGVGTALAVPVVADGDVVAVLVLATAEPRGRDDRLVELVESVAAEVGGFVSRMRAEESLAREREFLDRILGASPVGIAVFSDDGEVLHSNPRSAEILGVTDEEVYEYTARDRPVFDRDGEPVPPDERPFVRVFETGDPVHDWVGQVERPDGERRWVSVNVAPITNDDGEVEQVVTCGLDITDRKRRETQLRRERDFSDRVLEAVPLSVAVVDRDGAFERLNDGARERLGLGGPEGRSIGELDVYDEAGDLVPPEDRPYRRVFEEGEAVHDWEGQVDLPRGRTWMSLTAVPLGDDEPPERVLVAANDVTRLKEQARQLERKRDDLEAELNEVFERVTDAFYALDDEWRFTHVNDRAQELLGHSEEELLGESIWEAFPETDEVDEIREPFVRAMETQEAANIEVYSELLEFWVKANIYPSESGLSVYFQDITERKEREQELEEYERIVETVEEGVYALDGESRFLTANRAFAAMTGYDRRELAGAHVSLIADQDEVERVDRAVEGLEAADEPVTTVEATVTRADGRTLPVEVRVSQFEPRDGGSGRVGVVRDVSDRKRREERLRALNDTAQAFLRAESVAEVGETVVGAAKEVLDIPGVAVYRHDPDRGDLFPAATSAEAEFIRADFPRVLPDDSSLTGHVFASGEPRRYDDIHAEPQTRFGPDESAMRAGLFVPIGEYGVLVAGSSEVGAFDEESQRLVELLAANAEAAYERMDRERERERSERRYRTLAENFPNGAVALFDDDLRFELAAGGVFDELDVSAGDVEGRTLGELSDIGLGEEFAPDYRATLEGQETTFEVEVPGVVFEVHNVPVEDESGDVVYGLSMALDVTERVERERELEEYRAIVESVNDGVYTVDRSGTITRVNATYAEMVGRPREELVGTDAASLVKGDVAERARTMERELVDGERETATLEAELKSGDDETLIAEATFSLLPGEGDSYERIAVVRDVTERRERESELERALDLLERTETIADVGGWELDPETMDVFWSEHLFDVLGVADDEEPPLEEALDVYHEDDRPIVEAAVQEALDAGDPFDVEVRFRRPGGEVRWLRVQGVPETADGEVVTLRGAAQDVTERVERERELEEQRERYERLVEVAPVSIATYDPEGTLTYVNEAGVDLLGATEADDLLGEPAIEFVHPDDRDAAAERMRGVMEERTPAPAKETKITTLSGGVKHAIITSAPITREGVPSAQVVLTDITERVARERALERYETVFDTVDDGIYILGPEFHFQEVNEAYLEMTGYDEEEVVGSHCSLVMGEEAAGDAATLVRRIATGEAESSTLEADVLTKGGDRVPGESKFTALPSENGFRGSVGVVRDLTDRREYERELRRYETLIEESTDVNAIVDADGTFQYLTPSAVYVLGYEPEELYGESAFEYVHPDDVEEARANLTALVEGTEERPMTEFRFRHADGSWVWLEARGRNLVDDPAIGGVVTYTRDITDRKEYERELESRARQQSVVSELGHEALRSPDLSDLFEEAASLVAETLETDYCKVLDLDADAGELLLRQGVGWEEGTVGNATVASDDNSQAGFTLISEEPVVVTDLQEETRFTGPELLTSHDVTSGVSTVIGSHDDPWGILGAHDTGRRSFTDEDVDFVRSVANVLAAAIDRRRYQDELETVIAELEESNERLEQFAHVASHDLQEPLRMVSSYLQLLEGRYSDELDEDATEFIEFAVNGADRMREMINDLLTYSRVDTQAEPLEPTDCEEVVGHVLDNLQVRIAETEADVEVDGLPTVTADPNQLEQVFQNLVSNALKYSGEGPPRIEIGAERDGDEWVLRVSDDGIGMDPDRTDRIFDVFDRLHSHDEYPGTGIGLALCKKIVERHGGRIWVESAPGEGSTFYFTLQTVGAEPDSSE